MTQFNHATNMNYVVFLFEIYFGFIIYSETSLVPIIWIVGKFGSGVTDQCIMMI